MEFVPTHVQIKSNHFLWRCCYWTTSTVSVLWKPMFWCLSNMASWIMMLDTIRISNPERLRVQHLFLPWARYRIPKWYLSTLICIPNSSFKIFKREYISLLYYVWVQNISFNTRNINRRKTTIKHVSMCCNRQHIVGGNIWEILNNNVSALFRITAHEFRSIKYGIVASQGA